jgi:tRNA pseudouridine55 synthase
MKDPDGAVSGILLVDKPEGPTSHDMVRLARRALNMRRVGHTGTLDPFASGLLILCVGRATRLVELFHLLPKRYAAKVMLGFETTTDDLTGEPLERLDRWENLDRAEFDSALGGLTGEVYQVPPAYSAKRIRGRRAYSLAREGAPVQLDPSKVTVHSIEVTDWTPPTVGLEIWVSTGTYVRALARDLGRAVGCGGHLAALRRTQIGPFRVGEGIPAARLESWSGSSGSSDTYPALVSPLEALRWLPCRSLEAGEAEDVSHGKSVPAGTIVERPSSGYPVRDTSSWPVALAFEQRLVAVAERQAGLLQPLKVLHAA